MDDTVSGLAAQKIRELFAICGVENSEELLRSLTAHAVNHLREAQLRTGRCSGTESVSQLKGMTIETPFTPPHGKRGSERLMKQAATEGRTIYNDTAGTGERKRKKRKSGHGLKLMDQQPGASRSDEIGISSDNAPQRTPSPQTHQTSQANETNPQRLPTPHDSSLPSFFGSAYEMKVITTIIMECVKSNFAIAKYGQHTSTAMITTKLAKTQEYVDELSKYSYDKAIKTIRRDTAFSAGKAIQTNYNETIFWPIILKCAALIDPATLPPAKGPVDGFSMAEKAATRKFMEDIGQSLGSENQRQYRIFWKNIYEMREAGIHKVLLYRSKEFDSFCRSYSRTAEISLVNKIFKWEKKYLPHIEQLETRILSLSGGDLKRLSYLNDPQVRRLLKVPETSWNNASDEWASVAEEETFKQCAAESLFADNLGMRHSDELVYEGETDKSVFITLLPEEDGFLFVSSIIPICKGDFLGIFAGALRFSEKFSGTHGIPGPTGRLWLDYSQVTGVLNQMEVSEPGGKANVCLHWDVFCGDVETQSDISWRVSVKATKQTMPFEPLIRMAAQHGQYELHLSSENAEKGFLEIAISQ
ncbi:hypothetical protein NUU61_001485 [Penicillium alfredii]|uniref:Uncharacterized protein n=1 Tax=Penicillium alfredii TaxID=1506179 RepID=A0A9W9KMP0_9EURO|nr:uncharacterized protein NUU61_001485 [Penicillium alfredii]KAJ5111855.1 hypothetical protein NUU61_001485 [Penicillium alfredii]